jgi:hypothetical protein
MTWLINVDNGGTTTGFYLAGGGEAFLHPAIERFFFNANRRLRDARARQPSRIFRRRLTACSPRRGRACPRSCDDAGPILGATGPGLALQNS